MRVFIYHCAVPQIVIRTCGSKSHPDPKPTIDSTGNFRNEVRFNP